MTEPTDNPNIVRKLVVIFDICSSTTILEDLIRTENQARWQKVLTQMKRFLWDQTEFKFETYKFLGDGWILLIEDGAVTGSQLIKFMNKLCARYEELFNEEVAEVLSSSPEHVGVTFGIDEGSLLRLIMNKRPEYVGRALNVAARLQSAIKQLKGGPNGTLLISKNAYARLKLRVNGELVECKLANVTGGNQYQVRKVVVHKARPNPAFKRSFAKMPAKPA